MSYHNSFTLPNEIDTDVEVGKMNLKYFNDKVVAIRNAYTQEVQHNADVYAAETRALNEASAALEAQFQTEMKKLDDDKAAVLSALAGMSKPKADAIKPKTESTKPKTDRKETSVYVPAPADVEMCVLCANGPGGANPHMCSLQCGHKVCAFHFEQWTRTSHPRTGVNRNADKSCPVDGCEHSITEDDVKQYESVFSRPDEYRKTLRRIRDHLTPPPSEPKKVCASNHACAYCCTPLNTVVYVCVCRERSPPSKRGTRRLREMARVIPTRGMSAPLAPTIRRSNFAPGSALPL